MLSQIVKISRWLNTGQIAGVHGKLLFCSKAKVIEDERRLFCTIHLSNMATRAAARSLRMTKAHEMT